VARLKQAQIILRSLGLPHAQCNEISGLTFLALASIGRRNQWSDAQTPRLRIHDIISFISHHYSRQYAENTRETIRRQVIHQFEQTGIIQRNPDNLVLPTNSPRTHYALTNEVVALIRSFATPTWTDHLTEYLAGKTTLSAIYRKERAVQLIPVQVSPGKTLNLSPGPHNKLQVSVVDHFAPRFAPGAVLIYLGDTARKLLHIERTWAEKLHIPVGEHEKLPDVVLYHVQTNRLFLIEAVTSHGPVSPKRYYELEKMLSLVPATRVYVSAFPDFKEFKAHITDIAWETEVWISDVPSHLIHFNGPKFLPGSSSGATP
jgi:hypothetical protein